MLRIRERCKKKTGKKLTNVSFAFTHTYTLKKLKKMFKFHKRSTKPNQANWAFENYCFNHTRKSFPDALKLSG